MYYIGIQSVYEIHFCQRTLCISSHETHTIPLIEVVIQLSSIVVCSVLYKSIILNNMCIELFQSSLDISYLLIKYLTSAPIMVVKLYNEYLKFDYTTDIGCLLRSIEI